MVRAKQRRAVAAVEGTDLRTGLTEARVVGRDREVAHQVQDVSAADGVPGDLRDHRLREPTDLDLQVEDVEAADALTRDVVVAHVPVVAANALVAPGAERVGTGAGQDDRADADVVAGHFEGARELEERLGAEGVADLGTVDGDPRDAFGDLVDDVAELARALPLGQRPGAELLHGVDR